MNNYPTALSQASADATAVSQVQSGALTFSELAESDDDDPEQIGR